MFLGIATYGQNTIPFRNMGDNSQRLNTMIRNNPPGTIFTFNSGTYTFRSPINVSTNNITFRGQGVGRTILQMANNAPRVNAFINLGIQRNRITISQNPLVQRTGLTGVVFNRLTIDANLRVNSTIVNNNDTGGAQFLSVNLRNSGHDGISASTGNACHGLIVRDCAFENVQHNIIFIANRNTVARGARLTRLRAPFVIRRTTFGDGYRAAIVVDCGNDFFNARSSFCRENPSVCGNVRLIPQTNRNILTIQNGNIIINDNGENGPRGGDGDGSRRFDYSTDLRNSIVGRNINNRKDNTFGISTNWAVGLVQASNITIQNNIMHGPGSSSQRPEASNSSIFHIEQFCRSIRILDNDMTNNSTTAVRNSRGFLSRATSSFINVAAQEGRRRFRDNPVITFESGVGDIPSRSAISAMGLSNANVLRGDLTPNCFEAITPSNPISLNCRRPFHRYGPRNFVIRDNTFSTNTGVNFVMNFIDAENITIQSNNYDDIAGNETRNGIIQLRRGELGNCDITINEDHFTSPSSPGRANIVSAEVNFEINGDRDARLNSNASCITINGDNLSARSVADTLIPEADFDLGTNPIVNVLTINPQNPIVDYNTKIYNLSGALQLNNTGNGPLDLTVSNLPNGVYILNITTLDNNKTLTKKIVINN